MDTPARPHDDAGSLGRWRGLGEAVYVARAEPASVSIGLVVGDDACLVIDTGSTPAQGRAIRAAAERTAGVPLAGVVVTHAHDDHFFGLAGFGDVASYGHESLLDRLAHGEQAAQASGAAVAARELRPPTRPFALAAALDLGGVRAEMVHIGRGHTEGDVVVAVTRPASGRSRLSAPTHVFVGDLLETAGPPWFGADSFPMEWPATLDGVFELLDERTLLVPGHGEPVIREEVIAQRGEIAAVAGELHRLAESGIAEAQAAGHGEWPFPVDHIRAAIGPGFAALRAKGVRPTRPTLPLVDPGR